MDKRSSGLVKQFDFSESWINFYHGKKSYSSYNSLAVFWRRNSMKQNRKKEDPCPKQELISTILIKYCTVLIGYWYQWCRSVKTYFVGWCWRTLQCRRWKWTEMEGRTFLPIWYFFIFISKISYCFSAQFQNSKLKLSQDAELTENLYHCLVHKWTFLDSIIVPCSKVVGVCIRVLPKPRSGLRVYTSIPNVCIYVCKPEMVKRSSYFCSFPK